MLLDDIMNELHPEKDGEKKATQVEALKTDEGKKTRLNYSEEFWKRFSRKDSCSVEENG